MKSLKIILAIIVAIVFIIFFSKFFKKGADNIKSQKDTPKTEYIEHKWIRYDSTMVPLHNDFGEIHTLNYSDRFTFEESTQPYCVINNNNYMECGEKGQDVSKNMGTDNDNKGLRFKSNSGKDGYIKLVIWREVEIKKYI